MKYCKDTTTEHPLCKLYPICQELLNIIFHTEGCKETLFSFETGLNLDKVETERCKGKASREATMDLALGVSNEGKSKQMLLVEMKFNSKQPQNISKKEIDSKIKHAIDLLSQEVPIAERKIVLFGDKQIQVAKHYISRLYAKSPKTAIAVMTAREFNETYFNP